MQEKNFQKNFCRMDARDIPLMPRGWFKGHGGPTLVEAFICVVPSHAYIISNHKAHICGRSQAHTVVYVRVCD